MKNLCLLVVSLLTLVFEGIAQPAIPVHDPVIIQQDSLFYVFATGMGITVWSSANRKSWKREAPVFNKAPQWAIDAVPGFKGHIWAPDISYHNGKYYLFYSVSAFGKNTSCIGVAVNKTLHPQSPDYKWEDRGKVIQSVPGRDKWNAIDPNLAVDGNNVPWLTFGSFWDGIKLVQLNDDFSTIAQPEHWYTLASRPREFGMSDSSAGNAAIEAPFIFKKAGFYYLFVSFDYCCRGENSTYKIMVGRSENITGPYLDKEGRKMTAGGGSLVLEGDIHWHGVGHNAVYTIGNEDYLIFHGYDAADKGKSKLRQEKLTWENGWPEVAH